MSAVLEAREPSAKYLVPRQPRLLRELCSGRPGELRDCER